MERRGGTEGETHKFERKAGSMSGYSMGRLESLAQITLSEEEREQAAEDLEKMLGLIGKLEDLDTEGVEPMSHVLPVQNVFREDLEGEGGDRRCSVPSGRDGMFVVPRTFQ